MGASDKDSTCHCRRCKRHEFDLIPGARRSPRGGNGNSLQYSRLDNPMIRGARWATVYGVAKSPTGLSDWAHTHTHTIPAVVNEHLTLQEHLKILVTIKVCYNPQLSTSDNPSGSSRVFSVTPALTRKSPLQYQIPIYEFPCLPSLGKLPSLLFSCSLRMVAASVTDNYLDLASSYLTSDFHLPR